MTKTKISLKLVCGLTPKEIAQLSLEQLEDFYAEDILQRRMKQVLSEEQLDALYKIFMQRIEERDGEKVPHLTFGNNPIEQLLWAGRLSSRLEEALMKASAGSKKQSETLRPVEMEVSPQRQAPEINIIKSHSKKNSTDFDEEAKKLMPINRVLYRALTEMYPQDGTKEDIFKYLKNAEDILNGKLKSIGWSDYLALELQKMEMAGIISEDGAILKPDVLKTRQFFLGDMCRPAGFYPGGTVPDPSKPGAGNFLEKKLVDTEAFRKLTVASKGRAGNEGATL
ncbi:MAG: hypothetical protein J6Y85_05340 [Alphaproteobacteria bacterium]|nr:hypothetical protein [Alphaproteobacteria bacterium]